MNLFRTRPMDTVGQKKKKPQAFAGALGRVFTRPLFRICKLNLKQSVSKPTDSLGLLEPKSQFLLAARCYCESFQKKLLLRQYHGCVSLTLTCSLPRLPNCRPLKSDDFAKHLDLRAFHSRCFERYQVGSKQIVRLLWLYNPDQSIPVHPTERYFRPH